MKQKRAITGIAALAFILILFLLINYSNKRILIGFTGQLTGKQAELGVQERNGVILAVEKINKSGGIKGKTVELIIENDFGIPEKAVEAKQKLIEANTVAIIGHPTSGQTLAGLELINRAKKIMISPTTSTPKLSGIDDYFFRISTDLREKAYSFAEEITKTDEAKTMTIIYDFDNKEYSLPYLKAFSENYTRLGGRIVSVVGFSSSSINDFSSLVADSMENKPESLLIICSDIDTAMIIQNMRKVGHTASVYSSGWANTKNLIRKGGKYIEGLKISRTESFAHNSSKLTEFKNSYIRRFGEEPNFGAILGYETTMVLSEALKKTGGKEEGLKKALTKINNFEGLTDKFSIDKYGDVKRPFHFAIVKNGKYMLVKTN